MSAKDARAVSAADTPMTPDGENAVAMPAADTAMSPAADTTEAGGARNAASAASAERATAPSRKRRAEHPLPGARRRRRRAATDAEREEATGMLQRWWRARVAGGASTARVVQDFFAKGMSTGTAKAVVFDELAAKLREEAMLDVMSKACLRVFYLSFGRRGTRRIAEANLNIRVFLAAYMIAFHPKFVFENVAGELEVALAKASTALLASFHCICEELQRKPIQKIAREVTDDFPSLLHAYVKAFKAWKVPDEQKLGERIKHALSALYQAQAQLDEDEPEGSMLRAEFQSQQDRLRYKLLQVAGEAVLREFDEARGRGCLPLPTAAAAAAAAARASASSALPCAGVASADNNMYSSLPGRMTNEQLAHELLLDSNFKLDDNGGSAFENPVLSCIRERFHVAFWDSLLGDLQLQPPCYVRVVRVLSEIRDGVVDLARGTLEVAQIHRAIDVNAIQALVAGGSPPEWAASVGLIEGVVAVLKRLQAPKRDAETRTQWVCMQEVLAQAGEAPAEQPRAFCKALETVLERVNTIRVDASNARIRMIAPVIKRHGVEYERAHMEKRLKAAGTALERTARWLGAAVRAAVERGRVPLQSLCDGRGDAFEEVHRLAVLGLVTGAEALTGAECPETLMLDLHRLQAARAQFHFAVLGVTALVQLHQKEEARGAFGQALGPVAGFFSGHTPRVVDADSVIKAVAKHLAACEPPVAEAHRAMVAHALEKGKADTDPVRRIFAGPTGRIAQLWDAAASAQGPRAPPVPLPAVATLFAARIAEHGQKIKAVTQLNLRVHALHYNKMIAEAAKAMAAGAAGAAGAAQA